MSCIAWSFSSLHYLKINFKHMTSCEVKRWYKTVTRIRVKAIFFLIFIFYFKKKDLCLFA